MPERTILDADAPSFVDDAATVTGTVAPSAVPSRALLADRYVLHALVGSGGMGNVYRALDRELDEIVALKMLRRVSTAADVSRLRQEVKLARRVTHGNVVRTFDIGEHEGTRFITMEYVEGEPLASRLGHDEPIPDGEVVALANQIAAGLAAAHAVGVVHRDLKPANILVGQDGVVKITDFGIAGASAEHSDGSGTPAYMAPEQLVPGSVEPSADVYAFGVLLYHLLTGRAPFTARTFEDALGERKARGALDVSAIRRDAPPALIDLVHDCTALEPSERIRDGAELTRRLARISIAPAQLVLSDRAYATIRRIAIVDPIPRDPRGEAHARAIGEALFAALAASPTLDVVSPAAARERFGTVEEPRAVGRAVGAHVVVCGEAAVGADRALVTLRAVTVDDGFVLWEQAFDRDVSSMRSFGVDVARHVLGVFDVRGMRTGLGSTGEARLDELHERARVALRELLTDGVTTALEAAAEAERIAPDDPRTLALHARALTRRAIELYAGDADLDRAETYLVRATVSGGGSAALHLAWAQLHRCLGEHEAAAADLRAALSLDDASADVHVDVAEVLGGAGDVTRAIEHYERALALDPVTTWVSRFELGALHALAGDRERAEAIMGEPPADARQLNAYWATRLRMLVWYGDAELDARAARQAAGQSFMMRPWVEAHLAERRGGGGGANGRAALAAMATPRGRAKRPVEFFAKVESDVLASLGYGDAALGALRKVDGAGSADVTWFDRSPSLACLRERADGREIGARIAARAARVLAAFDGA